MRIWMRLPKSGAKNLDAVAEKWRKKLETHKEMAFLCRDIARLQTDLHIDGNLQQLRLVR